jgi:hypothetical protein
MSSEVWSVMPSQSRVVDRWSMDVDLHALTVSEVLAVPPISRVTAAFVACTSNTARSMRSAKPGNDK